MSEKERALIARTHEVFGTCLTAKHLLEDLRKLGVRSGMTLMVHCALSKIGWIAGGTVTLIRALLEVLGPDGTLIMPSHTSDNSDPSHWESPPVPPEWFDVIRRTSPAYQADLTPTLFMSKLVETFRHWPGVVRSQHPQFSVVAVGPKARWITDQHIEACGDKSPLARIYECLDDGYVLLLGVQHRNNTSLHLAEYRYQTQAHVAKTFGDGAAVINPKTNAREWIEWYDYAYRSDDFMEVGQAFEAVEGNVTIGQVGLAECRLMKQYQLVDFATDWMAKHRQEKTFVEIRS